MIEPSFNGLEDAFPDGGEIAETYTFEFTIDVSNEWDLDHLHVIGMLMDGNGLIDNGAQVDYNDALSIECGVPTVGLNEVVRHSSDDLKVYPNPASNMVNINADLKAGVDNQIVVRDVMGRVVFNQTISDQAGLYQVNLDISKINSGVYIVEMTFRFFNRKREVYQAIVRKLSNKKSRVIHSAFFVSKSFRGFPCSLALFLSPQIMPESFLFQSSKLLFFE